MFMKIGYGLKCNFLVQLRASGINPTLSADATVEQKRKKSTTKAKILLNVVREDAIDLAVTFSLEDKTF
ncbi:hypothetical protein PR048_009764 [Dryococelus australis]|uniref:Uncharacterized protein n=1 Tax=Dryococelus australis TaxID=614101 RepID=A0ABQ9I1L0_9NEOP|nr:hypothetical protein PR048_009764 [Dryococelus australis]